MISPTLTPKPAAIAECVLSIGLSVAPAHLRAPHYLGLRFAQGVPDTLLERSAREQAYAGVRASLRLPRTVAGLWRLLDRVDPLLVLLAWAMLLMVALEFLS